MTWLDALRIDDIVTLGVYVMAPAPATSPCLKISLRCCNVSMWQPWDVDCLMLHPWDITTYHVAFLRCWQSHVASLRCYILEILQHRMLHPWDTETTRNISRLCDVAGADAKSKTYSMTGRQGAHDNLLSHVKQEMNSESLGFFLQL